MCLLFIKITLIILKYAQGKEVHNIIIMPAFMLVSSYSVPLSGYSFAEHTNFLD